MSSFFPIWLLTDKKNLKGDKYFWNISKIEFFIERVPVYRIAIVLV